MLSLTNWLINRRANRLDPPRNTTLAIKHQPESKARPRPPAGKKQAPPENTDDRRERILRAAIAEFSRHGLAGARTDAIAAGAGVNKALLYYYFHSKTELYAAALEASAAEMLSSALQALEHEGSAGERLLRTALHHFDRIASQHEYRQLINQEMTRLREGGREAVPAPLEKIFSVLMHKMRRLLAEGMKSGELVRTDWMQVLYAVLGANVFYFLSAPMMRLVAGFDPLQERAIRRRRRAAVLFLGASLFADRQRGEQLARQVLADTPAPALKPAWEFHTSGVPSR